MEISTDNNLNPTLKKKVQSLRGGILGAAEKQTMPERFTFEPDPDSPAVNITDTMTGRVSNVSLCHLRGVRQTLSDLFGD